MKLAQGSPVLDALNAARLALALVTESAQAEAETLLMVVLGCRRADLFILREPLSAQQAQLLEQMVQRRCGLEPLQYITGRAAFRGAEFEVGPGVLVPRPETELVVEHALALLPSTDGARVIDIGTGSGAIGASIAAERPRVSVWATEVSPQAAEWARRNFARLGVSVELFEGDLFCGLRGPFDLVVSNPPYLSSDEVDDLPFDVATHEPRIALTAGPTGLEVPARIIEQSATRLAPRGALVMETSPTHASELASLFERVLREVAVHDDLGGNARIVTGRGA
ncbi:MAG TPA: peptide chain release factor N(5)-glutamine methyltransferase [Actinomycetota bacterium]|nr:peptide chain release factor N(5)-glutamine methyltransferase [Actinomycetota bacterium]